VSSCVCGRWLTSENEQVGGSCRGCLTEWVNRPLDPDDLEQPVAYWPTGIESECAGCGTRTFGRDLCFACDDTTGPRLVNV
jgi:hypothetical protein